MRDGPVGGNSVCNAPSAHLRTPAQHTSAGTGPLSLIRMDETPSPQTPESNSGLNKLDLTQLQGFSFGTSWSQDKGGAASGAPRQERRDDRPRRDGGAPVVRDRRGDFKRSAPSPAAQSSEAAAPSGAGAPSGVERPSFRRDGSSGGPGGYRGGERPRFERREGQGAGAGGARREGGPGVPRGDFRGPPREPVGPYISPFFNVTFYPEDASFKVLSEAIRKSCRTFELFYIARSVVEKNERFVAVVQRIQAGGKPSTAQIEGEATAQPNVKAAPFFVSVPDGVPFDTEDAAIAHVLEKHLGNFFESNDVEVEAPKGNFQVINRCTITGTLLAPPNYHRYASILAQHHAANIRIPLEAYKSKIETVRDAEVVAQWLEKMKKTTRYTFKPVPVRAPKQEVATIADASAPVDAAPATDAAPEAVAETAPTAPALPYFDSLEEARQWLLTEARGRVVRSVEQLRFPGKILEFMPESGEIRRAVEGALANQRRFPLDTANALRGRLRRESFTIFKKGSKGISYVCAVKRRFRVPGQTFSDSLASLIAFIEAHPMVKGSELAAKHLGLDPRPVPAEGVTPELIPVLEQEQFLKLKGDLRYLVKEGYVTEFVDGTLFCPPAMVEARKREIEASDIDPENFPEAPKSLVSEAPLQAEITPRESVAVVDPRLAQAGVEAAGTDVAQDNSATTTEASAGDAAPLESKVNKSAE